VKSTNTTLVRIVVDAEFGERLAELPEDAPIWIVNSAKNTPVAHRLWSERPKPSRLGITTFGQGTPLSGEDELLGILDIIDLHHGEQSASPPYSKIKIYGCSNSAQVTEAIKGINFNITEDSQLEITAIRNGNE
jgi:hypothetical protein